MIFDGFPRRSRKMTGSGQIRVPPATLGLVFGREDLDLLPDDGRLVSLCFSKKPPAAAHVAHVALAAQSGRRHCPILAAHDHHQRAEF
jgi:hypothetical protein